MSDGFLRIRSFRCIQRDVAVADMDWGTFGEFGDGKLYVQGMEKSNYSSRAFSSETWRADGDLLLDSKGDIYNRVSGKRLAVPLGRRFSPELARFAKGGWFVVLEKPGRFIAPGADDGWRNGVLIDLRTEKGIGKSVSDSLRYVLDRQAFIGSRQPSSGNRFFPALHSHSGFALGHRCCPTFCGGCDLLRA